MKRQLLVLSGVLACAMTPHVRAEPRATVGGIPVLDELPTTTAEFKRRAQRLPTMASIAAEGTGVYGGLTQFLLSDKQPVGPAPHTPWAKPLAGGGVRVISVSTIQTNADLAEIERRLECDMRHIRVFRQYSLPKRYPEALTGYLTERAKETLSREADVILAIPNVRLFPEEVARLLLKKVAEGCGLVVIGGGRYGGGQQYKYWPLFDKIETWVEFSNHFARDVDMGYKKFVTIEEHQVTSTDGLFDGIPWRLLPAHHLFRMEPAAEAEAVAHDGNDVMAIGGRWGKGRVLLLTWANSGGGFPVAEDNKVPRVDQYQEYHASALIRALLWAADRRPALRLTVGKRELTAGVGETVGVSVEGPIPARSALELRLRDLRCTSLWSSEDPLRGPQTRANLPALAAGEYLLDAVVRDGDGGSLGWASFALRAQAEGAVELSLDKDRYLPGESARITARVTDVPAGGLSARVEVSDALDRVLFAADGAVREGAVTWVYPNKQPLTVLHYVDVEVRRDGAPYLRTRTDLFVPRYQPDDFTCWLWPGSRPTYAARRTFRRQREMLGFDVIMCAGYGGTHRAANYALLTSGCLPFYSNIAPARPEDMEKEPLKTRKKILDMVDNSLDELRSFGGLAFFFQDERHGRGDCGEPTDEALGQFRAWLAKRYSDVSELNRAWGRQFAGFEAVEPVLTNDFDGTKETSLSPWLEWRLWALNEIVATDRAGASRIREAVGTPCNLGLEGIFGLATHNIPYGGTDLAAQSEFFNIAGPYGEDLLNACRSFHPDFLFSWSGYNRKYSEYQRYVWSCAFQGHGGLGWWYGPIYHNATDCWFPQARWIRDLTRPLREGIGKLIRINSPSSTEPIAFLYSQSSLYAMAVLGRTVDPDNPHLFVRPAAWARQSLQRMFQDAGVQFGYMSEKQLQGGKGAGLKLLVLSSCVALEPETCKALEAFVTGGGVVLADLCPGVWDHRGAYRDPGQLDRLFGVKRDERFRFKTMVSDWGVGTFETEPDFNIKGQWYIGQYYEETLMTDDGHALGKHIFGSVKPPAFVFKRTGEGATILTNYLETEYRRVPEHWQITLMKELLRFTGIEPPVVMRDTMQNGEILEAGRKLFRWQDGPAAYLGALLDEGRRVEFEFGRAGHVYEVARGEYLGHGRSATVDMRDQPHALLALLPYRVRGLKLGGERSRLGEGMPLAVDLAVTGTPARHVVHLSVSRPDGSRCAHLCRNVVLEAGRWRGTLPLALNEPAGRWTVRAREVVSGLTDDVRVRVKE